MRHWVNCISHDHVRAGAAGGFTQAGHGTDTRLRRLARGDAMVFYSPRESLAATRPYQHLTALGAVVDDEPWRDEETGHWRRRLDFETVRPVPIRPLLPMLGFVTDEQRWGLPFRRGLFEVTAGDFGVLAGALRDAAWVPDEYSRVGRSAERG